MSTHVKPRVVITVNGSVEFDGELGEWITTPPDFIKERISPDVKAEPWAKAVMLSVVDAVLQNKSVNIDVEHEDARWQLTVQQ